MFRQTTISQALTLVKGVQYPALATYLKRFKINFGGKMDLRVDIVVLGATGFTGKHAVKSLVLLTKEGDYPDIRWGIAGRSMEKLQNLLLELKELDVDVTKIPVFECEIGKEGALPELTIKARVIMNATGPNTLLSDPVVKSCIQTGTHYVDISAERHHFHSVHFTFPADKSFHIECKVRGKSSADFGGTFRIFLFSADKGGQKSLVCVGFKVSYTNVS